MVTASCVSSASLWLIKKNIFNSSLLRGWNMLTVLKRGRSVFVHTVLTSFISPAGQIWSTLDIKNAFC